MTSEIIKDLIAQADRAIKEERFDELVNFSRENSVRLLGMLEKNQIRIASAFPDPDPELLQHFPYAYYIEKPHRNITTFADQFGQLADELDEMLSGDATHV